MSNSNTPRILVTGGCGYIGSHTTLLLLQAGYHVVVLDNLSNGNPEALSRVALLAGKRADFIEGDIRDSEILQQIFRTYSIWAVIHFAGFKSVAESVARPLEYYDNNVLGTLRLLQAMVEAKVKKIVFSSSATVYGSVTCVPVRESAPLSATNPYGSTKLHVEYMLRDLSKSDPDWRIAVLRYFNPAGAHESGEIGEDPSGQPNNLMPYIAQVAIGKRERLAIFGDDYNTPDGSGVRDYIHVMDLAQGHIAALEALERHAMITCNLGAGDGYSVLEVVKAFSVACGKKIPYYIAPRRSGDVAQSYADPSHAYAVLNWRTSRGLETICVDHWRWQLKNPEGYK